MNKVTIAKYIRLSLEDSKYDSLSIPNQQLLLDRHIDSLDYPPDVEIEVIDFVDNGYSGVNFERPGVQKLLDLVRESKIDCIIVKDFSRFGRNSIETGYFIEMVFPIFRTRFISISDGFDSDDFKEDTGGMQVAFKFLMHEYYSHDMSKKSKTAKYAKMKRGEYQSVICPYGYRKGMDGRMEINEETAAVVRMIFEQALTMRSTSDVVKFLHERQIPTPGEYRKSNGSGHYDVSRANGIWQGTQIQRILEDERYIGTYIIGKRAVTEIGGKRSRLRPESEWIKIPSHHPAIVSRELYEQANNSMRRFKCPKKHTKVYPLKSKVVCGCCRHIMQIVPRLQRAFVCRHTKVDETAECHKHEISEQELEELLFIIISKQAEAILNTGSLNDFVDIPLHTEQQSEYEKKMDVLRESKRQLYEGMILGTVAMEMYKTEKTTIENELSHLSRAYDSLKAETAIMVASKATDDEIRHLAKNISGTNRLNRVLVELLIDRVYVYPDNRVDIDWKVSDFANCGNGKDIDYGK
jgi:DNA invertase Pin-like site-specific DNA recombinase